MPAHVAAVSPRTAHRDKRSSALHHQNTSQPNSSSLSTTSSTSANPASSTSASASQPLDYSADFDPSGAPTEVHRIPADQLTHLSDEQRNEVFTKTITAANPQLARHLTRFDYAEGGYKAVGGQSQLAVHFVMDGVLIHVESDEAKEQKEWLAVNKDRIVDIKSSSTDTAADNESSATPPMSPSARTRASGGEDEDEDGKGSEVAAAGPVNDKALKNQFNYSERGNQTINNALRDREVVTEPPPCVTFSGQVTHWEIFDTYCESLDKEISQRERNEKPKKKASEEEDDDEQAAGGAADVVAAGEAANNVWVRNDAILASASCQLALKTMERLVNQNAEAAAFHDYKYHDDPTSLLPNSAAVLPLSATANATAGANKKTTTHTAASTLLAASSAASQPHSQKGPFLPLWKFSHPDAKQLTVTSIAFNPHFSDLFAVAYGSYEFGMSSGRRGLVAVYTLKNVSYPEYLMEVAGGGVLSADWHATYPWLLVVGCYDGNVSVLDVRAKKGQELLYSSDNPKLKHTDCVWQVRWSKDDAREQPLHFYSVSADGRVSNWLMKKNELQVDDVLRLTPNQPTPSTSSSPPPAASSASSPSQQQQPADELLVTAGGSCLDFNQHLPHLFLLGTEEGGIHLYSKAYNTQHVRSYLGHHMAVYSLSFNPFHPGVFLSCSGDWQVKLWEMDCERPVMSFDLGCGVGDVCWSPFDSCVFVVVTADGRLRLFDLAVNKHDAVGELKVGKKAKLTRVSFSSAESIVCVGDDRGVVSVVKLTAIGGQQRKLKESGGKLDAIEEVRRLDRLLIMKEREGGRLPAYLRQYISGEERKREGKEKARAAEKAAADKASAAAAGANGGGSPVGSPKAKPMATPRGE